MGLSIFVPVTYITVLFLSLAAFSRVYRGRRAQRLVAHQFDTTSRIGEQTAKPIYEALAAIQEDLPPMDAPPGEWVVPKPTLQAALIVRAADSLRRMTLLQQDKHALSALLERGSIGDDATTMLEAAEGQLQSELMDIQTSAAAFHESWSKLIFESASQVLANHLHRQIVDGIDKQREEEGVSQSTYSSLHAVAKMQRLGLEIPKPTIELPTLPVMTLKPQ